MCFDFYSSKLVTFEVLIQCRTQVHLQRKKSKAFTCVLFKGLKGKREVVSLSAVGDFPRITCTTHPLCALQDPPGPSFSHLRLGRWLSHVLQACTGRANDWNLKESLCFHPGSHLQNILEFYSMMLPCTPLAGLVCGHPQSVFQGYELTGVLLPFRVMCTQLFENLKKFV